MDKQYVVQFCNEMSLDTQSKGEFKENLLSKKPDSKNYTSDFIYIAICKRQNFNGREKVSGF